MTIRLKGRAFLARSSRQVDASLEIAPTTVLLLDENGTVLGEFATSMLLFEAPLGAADRRATLPDGTLFETGDHDGLAELEGTTLGATLSKAERFHPRLILIIMAALAGVFMIWRFALPALVWIAVALTPEPLRDTIDAGSLSALDVTLTNPSSISPERQTEVRDIFDALLAELPADTKDRAFRLEFRDIPGIGPNAAALPGGTVVITDALIEQFGDEDVIAAVLAHELGHVVEDHGLTQLYRSLGVFVLVTLIAGDTGPILEDVLLEGSLIMSLSFSRAHEASADQFGLRLAESAGYDPAGLIGFFKALPDADQQESGWKSTHPASGARIQAIEDYLRNR